ncbi:MAG: hypothetical protein PHI44_05725 [Candidatus Ratteibacteria bacterium]|nr:hypothetical protein [Candidatus Ratteibacteria bacterium]
MKREFPPLIKGVRGGLVRGESTSIPPHMRGEVWWGWLESIFRFSVLDLEFNIYILTFKFSVLDLEFNIYILTFRFSVLDLEFIYRWGWRV